MNFTWKLAKQLPPGRVTKQTYGALDEGTDSYTTIGPFFNSVPLAAFICQNSCKASTTFTGEKERKRKELVFMFHKIVLIIIIIK